MLGHASEVTGNSEEVVHRSLVGPEWRRNGGLVSLANGIREGRRGYGGGGDKNILGKGTGLFEPPSKGARDRPRNVRCR